MAKKMLIDATHSEETRVVVVDGNKVEEFDFESENKRQLAGNIYLAKVTRVEPSLQAAFVDYGGNRHGFLAFSEIHPDYYQIPVADREALLEEERAYAEAQKAEEDDDGSSRKRSSRSRSRSRSSAASAKSADAVATREVNAEIAGMETIDLDEDEAAEGSSPMERVAETPVEEPTADTPELETEAQTSDESDASDDEDDDGPVEIIEKDDTIENVSEEDDPEDVRPVRKPRPRRYKIQEVIKVRQILLVQVVKEERGNKGAALTTYLSLAGRYCVLMPNTARGGGISRKITNAADRKKLKDIATEIDVPRGAGLIIRTAGAKRTKAEIKRDYEYLFRLWEQIRKLTLESVAPAKIYEEGDLIKRSIRDLYNRDIDEVLVEGERGYRIAKDFMKMIMPSHAKNVKHYGEQLPLFARYQVESYLSSMFNPVVQLKSGGYIVIGVTEALVAIDVNSGRATKEGSIEETALKTNLEAAEEVARQLRLRDLAGLIVIDFIDMDERKNNASVEKRLKDKLKTDRARIQVGRISGFGLLEMSRQRLRPGMIEATTQPCPACHGTGLIRSDDNLALSILRQIEEEGTRRRSREVLVKCPVGIANFIMNQKREHVAGIEARYGLSVRIEGDPMLISPDFTLEKFKTATRSVPEQTTPVVSVDSKIMDEIDEAAEAEDEDIVEAEVEADAETEEENKPKKRRRRRRRSRSRSSSDGENGENGNNSSDEDGADDAEEGAAEADASEAETTEGEDAAEEAPKKRSRRRRSRSKSRDTDDAETSDEAVSEEAAPVEAAAPAEEAVEPAAAEPVAEVAEPVPEAPAEEPAAATEEVVASEEPAAEPVAEVAEPVAEEQPAEPQPEPVAEVEEPAQSEPAAEVVAEPAEAPVAVEPEVVAEEEPDKPKRRGWWNAGR
ncbi:ribonuclease E/G [Thalassobius vesicularis]|uniref:Ribonuclease E n=1 Tax=Thalassobius vesicularis TaxID=1294297 RepID=A0A4S3M9H9_9RHOB|nr:ribonuclease E/G [Thalassobius vesicularis]THD73515.1 ribonuclease E/G [Thalassobius vesicularis]